MKEEDANFLFEHWHCFSLTVLPLCFETPFWALSWCCIGGFSIGSRKGLGFKTHGYLSGSIYTTIMELGRKRPSLSWFGGA